MHDFHGNSRVLQALAHAVRTGNAVTTGDIIDLQDFEHAMFVLQSGTITDGSFAVEIQHGDQANLSDATVATADELKGTMAAFAAGQNNIVRKISYRRAKRYVRLRITQTGATTGGALGGIAILNAPRIGPTS